MHYGRQKCGWVCLCIRILTDLGLFSLCSLVSVVHCPLAVAKLKAEKSQKIQYQRKPLCQCSDGERRKAPQSHCTPVCFDRDAPLWDMSHAAITQTWQTLVFFLNTGTLWWDSLVSSLALYCFPLFSFSSVFLLFHIITSVSSTALRAAWEYWAMQDPRLKAADQQHPANTNWFFFSF